MSLAIRWTLCSFRSFLLSFINVVVVSTICSVRLTSSRVISTCLYLVLVLVLALVLVLVLALALALSFHRFTA